MTQTQGPGRGAAATRPWLALVTTMAVQILSSLTLASVSVLAPAVAPQLGLAPEQVGLFVGLSYMVAMLSGIATGPWVGRLGAAGLSQWLLAILTLGAVVVTSGMPLLLLLGSALIGVCNGMNNPAAAELLGRHVPATATGSFFALKQTSVPVGIGLAGLLMPWGLVTVGWQASMWILGGVCVLLALLMAPSVRILDAGRRRDLSMPGPGATLRAVWRLPALRDLGLMSLAYAMAQQAFLAYVVAMLTLRHGLSLPVAAGMLAASQVACSFMRIGLGPVADRWVPPRQLLVVLGAATSLGCLALGWMPTQAGVLGLTLAVVACGATAMGWNGLFFAELVRRVPREEVAAAAGGTQFFTFLGAMIGPVFFGALLQAGVSYAAAYSVIALIVAAGAWLMVSPTRR